MSPPASSDRPLVEIDKLWKRFDVSKPWLARVLEGGERRVLTAVADVSFAIPRKSTFALVGESGSGKSTIAKLLVGLIEPSEGRVAIDGTDITTASDEERRAVRRKLQMVFQDPYASLNPRWRVTRIIAEPIKAHGIISEPSVIEARVAELLRLVGLDPADGNKYPHEFSGGQRQRIAVARALAAEPQLIVADEPTSALDVSVQAQILNLMRDLQDRLGLTYLFISHNLAVVRHMASEIGVLYLGRLVEVAPPEALFESPKHPYTRMLLDAVPDVEMTGRTRKAVEGEIPSPVDLPSGCGFHPRCPLANARCKAERPVLKSAGPGRTTACHAVEEGRG